jgi:hypothetical protein
MNKIEIQNSKSEFRLPIECPHSCAPRAHFFRFRISNFEFFRRFRIPRRFSSDFEEAAARNRAERLFEVNFRSWTR